MLLSQHDIQSSDLSLDPPITKRATNRKIFLIAKRGAILEGIKYSKKKRPHHPGYFAREKQPELLDDSSTLEQLNTPMTRDVLATRIAEELNKGIPWPDYRGRNR